MKRGMTVMSKSLRAELEVDPRKSVCAFKDIPGHVCGGRITREHAMYYAGKKIQERWAIVFICAKGHGVDIEFQDAPGQISKEMRQWVALYQATDADFDRFPRAFPSFRFQRNRLFEKYGRYVPPEVSAATAINY